jgi:hypothetical protein
MGTRRPWRGTHTAGALTTLPPYVPGLSLASTEREKPVTEPLGLTPPTP